MAKVPIEHGDITSIWIFDNDTWNDCPKCGKFWKDRIATPGLIHKTRLCDECKKANSINN
jgi:hypothetical protein